MSDRATGGDKNVAPHPLHLEMLVATGALWPLMVHMVVAKSWSLALAGRAAPTCSSGVLLIAMLANQRLSIRSKDDPIGPAAATCEYASTHVW